MANIQVTPDKLRTLAKTLGNEAKAVGTVKSNITSAIGNSGWKSPAATKFEHDWNTHTSRP